MFVSVEFSAVVAAHGSFSSVGDLRDFVQEVGGFSVPASAPVRVDGSTVQVDVLSTSQGDRVRVYPGQVVAGIHVSAMRAEVRSGSMPESPHAALREHWGRPR